jgi:outer membrane protein OmpA-like peptidoglycan-associated protein
MTKSRLIRFAMITTALPLVFAVNAVAFEKPSLQIAQQAQDQKQLEKKQDRPQRPAVQERRQDGRESVREHRQDRRENAKEQRQERHESTQDRRQERREQVRDRRENAKEQKQERRENAQEKRQERHENAQDKRQERRENVQEKRQDRRENVQERRQDKREDAQRARRLEDLRDKRQESREGNRVVIREPGRTIIRENGRTIIRHNEVERFRRFGGRDARVERRGKETFTVVERPGYRIVTVTGSDGRLIRRLRRYPNGREVVIIDNRPRSDAPGFFVKIAPPVIKIPRDRYIVEAADAPPALLYGTLIAPPVDRIGRAYALDEIRYTQNLRERMRRVDLDTVTFETGSWDVTPQEAARLEPIAQAMQRAIKRNPEEVFLIEGHTDAVGDEVDNLSLSDRRAEAVAIVLTERYGVPPENLTTQGYGEQNLKVSTEGAERRNRRVTVLRITPLLRGKDVAENSRSGG